MRPKNEEAEKEKFKYYWDNQGNSKGKVYNPRFQYMDSQRAFTTLTDMKVVFSTKYRSYAKAVVEEVIKIFGSPQAYKEETWGKEINKEEIMEIVNKYMKVNRLSVDVFFG